MRLVLLSAAAAVLFSAAPAHAQTRREAIEEFTALEQKIEAVRKEAARLEQAILQPDKEDFVAAERENAKVFRILPREKYDKGFFAVRGGGAFYSFINASHSYNDTPQIALEQNYLAVGFYGASYGFLTDLGGAELAQIDEKNKSVAFLANYRPPLDEPGARVEQTRARGFEFENVSYKNRLAAIVGNTYVLRAVSYDEADTLVAFKVHRKDADGSLIIFWRMLGNFEKPKLIRGFQAKTVDESDFVPSNFSGNLIAKIENALRKKGFDKVRVELEKGMIVLRGRVPKGKLPDAVQTALEAAGKPIRNELTIE